MIRAVLKSMRPHQWVKNSFVLAPLVFAQELTNAVSVGRATAATILFCLAAGAVYLLNDCFDAEKDRAHPLKKLRPIASGQLPEPLARRIAFGCALVAVIGGFLLGIYTGAAISSYLLVNIAYSRHLKHVPYVDVATIAFGFLLRIAAGAFAIPVPLSVWIFACTFLLALYMGLGKRRHELMEAMEEAHTQRNVLARYTLSSVTGAMLGTALATCAAYTAYTLDDSAHEGATGLAATIPFIVIGLTRFFTLSSDTRTPASPTERLVKDPFFVGNLAVWGIVVIWLFYT